MISKLQSLPAKNRGRILLAGIGLLVAVFYTMASYRLGIGSLKKTESGMFPFVAGIAFAAVSILTAIEAMAADYGDEPVFTEAGRRKVVLGFSLLVVGLVVLLPYLGQYLAASIFGSLAVRILSGKSWVISIVAGTALAVVLSYSFIEFLGVLLPEGPWIW